MKNRNNAIILGIVCFVLTLAICVQIKTVKMTNAEFGSSINDNNDKKDKVLRAQEEYKGIYDSLQNAEKELEEVRQLATENNVEDEYSKNELNTNNGLLGLTEIKGKGIVIKLDDNRDIKGTEVLNVSNYLVHEGDLLQIVNELFNAGADAISINNQRVVPTTSILCDGNIIRVNGEIISVPITIKAIGYPESLYYALMRPQGYLEIMENDGVVVDIEKSEDITISKFDGVYSSDYISGGDI